MAKRQKTDPGASAAWEADPRPLWGIDVGAFILGSAALLALSGFRVLISLPFAVVLILAMATFFGGEIGFWYVKGVRRVLIESGCVVLECGPDRAARRIMAADIARVRQTRRLGSGRIIIELTMLDNPPWSRLPMRFLRGRIALRSELFTAAGFKDMFEELSRMASRRIRSG